MKRFFSLSVLALLGVGLAAAQTITPENAALVSKKSVKVQTPTGPVNANQQSGADICAKIITAMKNNPQGAEITVHCGGPGGIYTCTNPSYPLPNDGATPPKQASFKVLGCTSDAGTINEPTLGKVPTTGTIINFTGPSTPTGRFDTRGQGTLEFAGITLMDSGTGCSPFIFDTNTILKIHDNYFYGSTPAYITNIATRVQTSGGSTTLKYFINLGASQNGMTYRYFMEVKNQGTAPVIVANATQGALATIPAGTVRQVGFDGVGDGVKPLQWQFQTQNIGDAIDVVAYAPQIQDRSGANLITGPSVKFAGSWTASGGATATITQNQNVDQEPCNDGIVLGGGTFNVDGTANGAFQGYGTEIRANNFNNIQRAVRSRGYANAVVIENNTVWINSGSSNFGAFDFDTGAQGTYVEKNTIEVFAYKWGVHAAANALNNSFIIGNTCWDNNGTFPYVGCVQMDSGSTANVIISSNVVPPDVIEGTPGQNVIISTGNKISFPTPPAAPAQFNRIACNLGSRVVPADFLLSAGWGSTAKVSMASGTDCAGVITISSSGAGQAPNPTITYTPHDGSWPSSPVVLLTRQDTAAPQNVQFVPNSAGGDAEMWTFSGTPIAGNTYGVYYHIVAKP